MTSLEELADWLKALHGYVDHAAESVAAIDGQWLLLGSLTKVLDQAAETAGAAAEAARMLADCVPLASHFPEGNPAPSLLTPKQVTYLAYLARIAERATPAAGAEPASTVRVIPASAFSRPLCSALRRDGLPCRADALRSIERRVCFVHATPEERERHQARRRPPGQVIAFQHRGAK